MQTLTAGSSSVCSYGWSQRRALFVAVLCVNWPSQLVTLTTRWSNTSTPTWRTARYDFFHLRWTLGSPWLFFLFRFYPGMVSWACLLLFMELAQYNHSVLVQGPLSFFNKDVRTLPNISHKALYQTVSFLFSQPISSFVHRPECYRNSRHRKDNSAVSLGYTDRSCWSSIGNVTYAGLRPVLEREDVLETSDTSAVRGTCSQRSQCPNMHQTTRISQPPCWSVEDHNYYF